jgi:hypothetical protein
MSKLIGVGGTTESITKRNPTQRKLWVAIDAFEKEATALGIAGVPGYEALLKEIIKLAEEISKKYGEKWQKERERAEIIALEERFANAFVDFAKGIMRISGKWVEIIRVIDPTLPQSTTEADIQTKLADEAFIAALKENAKNMDDTTIATLKQKVNEAGSVDFSKLFTLFESLFSRYKTEKPKLVWLESDIERLGKEIIELEANKATKESIRDKLDPLYRDMKTLEAQWNKTTAISRIVNMAAGAVLATGLALGSWVMKQSSPSAPGVSQTVAAVANTWNTITASGHTITNNNWVISIVQAGNQTLKSSDGSEFQFNTTKRTVNYKLTWAQWVDDIPLWFTGNNGEMEIGGKKYKITFSANSITVIPQ